MGIEGKNVGGWFYVGGGLQQSDEKLLPPCTEENIFVSLRNVKT
jgi:hypothetical protein